MKKFYSLLLLGGLLLFGAQSAFADDPTYGWYEGSMSIGGKITDPTSWSSYAVSPTDLGFLTDMTISAIAFNVWCDANDRGGADMYLKIWDGGAEQVGEDQHIWLGGSTTITEKTHDFAISWSGDVDLAAAVGLVLEPGKTYYIDMYAKTYGTSGDQWYNGVGNNYHAKFVYIEPCEVTIGVTGWTTISCNYPLNLANMTASAGTVTAFYASSVNASSVSMTSTTAITMVGEGIMLKGTPGATITIPAVNSEGSALSGNLLIGCPTGTTVNHDSNSGYNYVLINNGGAPEFQLIVDGSYGSVSIPAGKAYLALGSNPSGAPALRIIEQEDNATGIQNVEANEKAVKFIENGKLFIQRDGIVYDMTGRVVR